MKPNELSELFNFSERKKYDIFKRDITYDMLCNTDIEGLCAVGAIALVTDDDQGPDVFPAIDVAVITGYKVEDCKRKFIVRKLSDLSVSYTVTYAVPLGDLNRPVVLSTGGTIEPRTCSVIGYRVSDNYLYVKLINDEDAGIVGLPLEGIQAIKKES